MNKTSAQQFMNLFDDLLNEGTKRSESKKIPKTSLKGDQVDLLNSEKELRLYERLNGRNLLFLKKVEAAKQRIIEGTFGQCEECGVDISQKRLLARPTATLCIGCQEDKERGEKKNINTRRDLQLVRTSEEDVTPEQLIKKNKFDSVKDIGFESAVEM